MGLSQRQLTLALLIRQLDLNASDWISALEWLKSNKGNNIAAKSLNDVINDCATEMRI